MTIQQGKISSRCGTVLILAIGLFSHFLSAAAMGATCQKDSDCAVDHVCVKSSAAGGCAPGTDCTGTVPSTSSSGSCAPVARTCETELNCPGTLKCKEGPEGICSGTENGSTTTCTPGRKVCTFTMSTCELSSTCPANHECVVMENASCPEVEGSTCIPGKPIYGCFPKMKTCTTPADCSAEESCFLIADAREGLPPAWVEKRSERSCVPLGLAFALKGHAILDRTAVSPPSSSKATTDSADRTSSGCSLGSGRSGGLLGILLVIALSICALRRRK